jgi:hypothetical protein
MIYINWGDRPTDKHCWLEAVDINDSNESGWYILKGAHWVHANKAPWYSENEGELFIVHRKAGTKTYGDTIKGRVTAPMMPLDTPIEPYKPVVGEWHWLAGSKTEVFYVGALSDGWYILEFKSGMIERYATLDLQPIKTEREQFIEKVADAVCSASIEQLDVKGNVKRIAGILYDARFKGPYKQLD